MPAQGVPTRARALLAAAGYEVAGEAVDGQSGVRAARDLRPEVVLLDVQLPDITGFEVARGSTRIPIRRRSS